MRRRLAGWLHHLAYKVSPDSTVMKVEIDAKAVENALAKLKRERGGMDLGFE